MFFLSKKIFITAALILIFLLAGVYFYKEARNGNFGFLQWLLRLTPVSETAKTDYDMVLKLAGSLLQTQGEEKSFLILFQNNMELRPGGGFIGSFGVLKVRDGHVTHFAVHDTGNFDGRIPDTIEPPYPMEETLGIDSWKLRDSNYSPDFGENAAWAEKFYQMGGGTEQFDGIVGITTNVLASVLEVTGPVEVPGFPGTYDANNAVIDLEYQVEQGYRDQNIDFGERKSFMGNLGNILIAKVKEASITKKYELFQVILDDLHQKDIQLFFKDKTLQADVLAAGWSGRMDTDWKKDYLMVVDANLGAYKSDYVVKRRYTYAVDLSEARPSVKLEVHYEHTGTEKNWFINDYQSFLRVYVPEGSYLERATNTRLDPVFGKFSNKKYFGALIQVPIGSSKTVTFEYLLPEGFDTSDYDLMIQKQAGLTDIPVRLVITHPDGRAEERNIVLHTDMIAKGIER